MPILYLEQIVFLIAFQNLAKRYLTKEVYFSIINIFFSLRKLTLQFWLLTKYYPGITKELC